ncbi:glycosyltransferase [Yoonia sp.]|uniref:glycosyltransferase family 2 protein n=1 Tax=Yoonia sp. TaxID=2212373 RepID=UPI0019FD8F93|nr:glycosyltransferase [Yoonia sp.]MBE0414739.1 glycosyltransferase [Yoonia sp.]
MNSSVSVIIPAYNAEKYLEEAVASVLRQSVPPVEILIVDDGSTDRTLAIAQGLAAQHAQITVLTRPNGGSGPARNTGIAQASGEYLLFLDADDRLHENAIRDHLRAFADRPEAVMVFGANDVIDAQGVLINPNPTPVEDVTLEDLAMRVTPCPSQCLYRRAAVLKINGYNEAFQFSQDVDLNLRIIRIGGVFSHGIKVMDYRRHPTQSTSKGARISRGHIAVLESNFDQSAPFPDPGLLQRSKAMLYSRYGLGQFRAALGLLRRGRFSDAGQSARLALLRLKARFQGQVWPPKRS